MIINQDKKINIGAYILAVILILECPSSFEVTARGTLEAR